MSSRAYPASRGGGAGTEERPFLSNKGTGWIAVLLLGAAVFAACWAEQTRRQRWTAADNLFLREWQALADAAPEAPP